MNIQSVKIPKKENQMAFYLTADGHLFDELSVARRHTRKLCDCTVHFIVVAQGGRIVSEREVAL